MLFHLIHCHLHLQSINLKGKNKILKNYYFSGKKNKNCYICRIKPIKIVSEFVDIEDPNMLDNIESSKEKEHSCICNSPEKDCNNCTTMSNKKLERYNKLQISTRKNFLNTSNAKFYNRKY